MEIYENITRKYYGEILSYCSLRLCGNVQGAEDCTQEVFLALYKKIHKLRLDENIRAWLYESARRETLRYIRKNKDIFVDLDELDENLLFAESGFEQKETVLDSLEKDELDLIEKYYSDNDREQLARSENISMNGLYLRIYRIRKKLLDNLNNYCT